MLSVAAAAVLAVGVSVAVKGNGPEAEASGQATTIVHVDRAPLSSAAQLADYAEVVAKGTFTSLVGTANASAYQMAVPGDGDFPMDVWNFHVERSFKGGGPADQVVVTYHTDSAASEEAVPVTPGTRAVVFLTRTVNGARVVAGGAQGILMASNGKLKPVAPGTDAFPDAPDENVLARSVH
jgi:hypothetical protein